MYQRRGGKVRPDARRLSAELVAGVAVGSGSNAGKRQAPSEPAPPTSAALPPPTAVQMRRPSALDSYNAAESEAEQKEQTKKQLESITGRMFQVLNDFEDDEESYTQSFAMERRRLSHSSQTHKRQMMQSNIDGMMANYDQVSAEREELLESLADWFQQGHIDAGGQPFPDLSHTPALSSGPRARTALSERTTTDMLSREQHVEMEGMEGDSDLPQDNGGDSSAATRDAVTMSWKYAAMEIYGLLSDVRDTDAVEMNALEQRVMELVASLAQQSKVIERISAELQHQKELVRFSDKTMQGLANDNSELREQLDRVRGQLVEAHKAAKSGPGKSDGSCKGEGEETKERDGEMEQGLKSDSSDGKNVDFYKAQIKDLQKRIAQLQEENKHNIAQSPAKTKDEEKVTSSNSIETTPSNPGDHTPSLPSTPNGVPQSMSQTEEHAQTETTNIRNDNHDQEVSALREQLQRVLQEKRALEEECGKRRKAGGGLDKGRGKKGRLKAQSRSQHTQTAFTESKHTKSPPHPVSSHRTPITTHTTVTHSTPSHTHPATATSSTVTTATEPVTNNAPATNSTAPYVTTALSGVAMDTTVTMETVAMDTTALPNITVATDTVTMTTTAETKTGVLDMVEDIINKVIINQSDLIAADTNTLHRIHGDLQQLCDVILSCLVHSSVPEEREGNNNDVISSTMQSLASGPYTHLPPQENRVISHQPTHTRVGEANRTRDGGRGERSEPRPPTREEVEMFIGQAIQSIQNEEMSPPMPATHQDKLQKMFEVLHSHRRHQEELGTIAYPLPSHFLTHNGGHVTDLHCHNPREVTEQLPNLDRSVSVRGVASRHDIHGNTYSKGTTGQMNPMPYLWGHEFQAHSNLSHHPTLDPSLLLSPHTTFPVASVGGLGMFRYGAGAAEVKRGGGKEGKKGRRKKQTRHSQVVRSNFLHVGNTFSTPPRTAPPVGLRGVANSLGNHHHANQTTHSLNNQSEVPPNNLDSGATFIDLLMQTPQAANGNSRHSNKTQNGRGGETIKLPSIR